MFPHVKELPEEMKDALLKLQSAAARVYKAQRQAALWKREWELAEEELKAAQNTHREVAARWDSLTNKMTEQLEDPPRQLSNTRSA
jgi:hypothetical protein